VVCAVAAEGGDEFAREPSGFYEGGIPVTRAPTAKYMNVDEGDVS
jgi:hypothetical protein